jgi:hypothetical protein
MVFLIFTQFPWSVCLLASGLSFYVTFGTHLGLKTVFVIRHRLQELRMRKKNEGILRRNTVNAEYLLGLSRSWDRVMDISRNMAYTDTLVNRYFKARYVWGPLAIPAIFLFCILRGPFASSEEVFMVLQACKYTKTPKEGQHV